MLSVIISACLFADPTACRRFQMPISPEVASYRCMNVATAMLPAWSNDHPKWQIKRWTCGNSEVADL